MKNWALIFLLTFSSSEPVKYSLHEIKCSPPKENKERWVYVYHYKTRYEILVDSLKKLNMGHPSPPSQVKKHGITKQTKTKKIHNNRRKNGSL